MRVLVTGATGFIGTRLCEILNGAGHDLVGLSRDPAMARTVLPQLDATHEWGVLEGPPPAAAFSGVDAVVHLAGESVAGRWTGAKKRSIRESRVGGTRNLVAGIERLEQRPSTLVAASAIGYYGDRGDEELPEDAGPGGDFLADVCQAWEHESTRAESLGVRVVRLRIGVVVGARGGALQAMLLPFKLGVGGPLGSGRQWWSWVHRDDLVAMIRHALETEVEGPVNATAPQPIRQKDFARVLGRELRRPSFLPTPAFALKLVLGGFSSELLSSKRVIPSRLAETGFEYRHAGLEAALREALG